MKMNDELKSKMNVPMFYLMKAAADFEAELDNIGISYEDCEKIKAEWDKIGISYEDLKNIKAKL